jgi:hypothetical protein
MRVALALVLVEISLASPVPAAPIRAQPVLDAAARAMGRFDSPAVQLHGVIEAEGRTGDFREAVRTRDGAYVTQAQYKMFGDAEGYNGRVRWKQDRSAASHELNAPFTKADSVSMAWLKRRGYLQRGSARVERVTHEVIDGRRATVLHMRPRGGNAFRLAFDDSSHLLVRVQRDRPLSTVTESYSVYRRIGGIQVPFEIRIEDSGDVQAIHLDRYQASADAAAIGFSMPKQPDDMVMTGSSTIPLEAPAYPVVPATINGRQYDFILDTGGHNIVTPAIAAELGLKSEGAGTSGGSGPGRAATSDTYVAELRLGSATMTNQHFTVLDLGNAVKRKDKPPMAGILGLEIFERMAVTIDEPGGRLTIDAFEPGRRCEGDKVPLVFDDDQPSAKGTIDGIPALIGIDVGNGGIPIVLWRWAEAHKVADRFRNGEQGSGHGVGGTNVTYRTKHHNIVVGRTAIRDTDINYATTSTGYFSSRADGMNLGRTLLQLHPVRFDYSQGHMCILPARTPA